MVTVYGKARKTSHGTLIVNKILNNGETKMFGKYKRADKKCRDCGSKKVEFESAFNGYVCNNCGART